MLDSGLAVGKRLQSELMSLMMAQIEGISAFPEAENLLKWKATIRGPADTPYDGLDYKLLIDFPLVILKLIKRLIHIYRRLSNSNQSAFIQMLISPVLSAWIY